MMREKNDDEKIIKEKRRFGGMMLHVMPMV